MCMNSLLPCQITEAHSSSACNINCLNHCNKSENTLEGLENLKNHQCYYYSIINTQFEKIEETESCTYFEEYPMLSVNNEPHQKVNV